MRLEPFAAALRAARTCERRLFPAIDFLLPTDCFGCGERLGPRQSAGACLACWAGFRLIRPPWCDACGRPRPPGTDLLGPARGRCGACLVERRPVARVRAAVEYDDLARRFLLRAKLGGRRELFEPLGGQLLAAAAASDIADGCSAVVGVPSHPWTTLSRGFTPGLELARLVARGLGLPRIPGALAIRWSARRNSKRLAGSARRAAARTAFKLGRRPTVGRVLLVDDVWTTGATVEACARLLRRAGSKEVRALVWARTPD